MTPENTQSAEATPETALPSTHFQTIVALENGTNVGIVVLEKEGGDIQFFLDRQLSPKEFGPEQIVAVLMRLSSLTNTLNKYVTDRINEAKEVIEKEGQLELPLDANIDGNAQESPACEAGPCLDECCGRQDTSLTGLQE